MTSPGAIEAIDSIEELKGKAIIGAGSVLDPETAMRPEQILLSPILNKDVIALCKRYGKIVVPGAFLTDSYSLGS